ncbi:MAG: hypothetical protein IPP33_15430 [Flavobacteriales bacterium]|nr:hypothetical protein [Flavobacteriales bacterium]
MKKLNVNVWMFVVLLLSKGSLFAQGVYVPPDHKGQAQGTGFAMMPQMNQIGNTYHEKEESVAYASTGNPVELFLRNDATMSFVLRMLHNDTTIQDTTLRISVQITGEMANPHLVITPVGPTTW